MNQTPGTRYEVLVSHRASLPVGATVTVGLVTHAEFCLRYDSPDGRVVYRDISISRRSEDGRIFLSQRMHPVRHALLTPFAEVEALKEVV